MKLFDRDAQLGTGIVSSMTCGDAVAKGTIANETLAYFMARTQLFMLRIGMNSEKLRFRQHLSTEMAHYAADCWDLEILTAYGWVESWATPIELVTILPCTRRRRTRRSRPKRC